MIKKTTYKKKSYQAIVIGGGHSGVEAVFALAKKNIQTLLITLDKTKLAMMPCNPSIGGTAKGIITKEIDCLGGVQGKFADQSAIQMKMLNAKKGPSVQALRAQIDKKKYSKLILKKIQKIKKITILENIVIQILVKKNKIYGIKTKNKKKFFSNNILITTGTYMNSKILFGKSVPTPITLTFSKNVNVKNLIVNVWKKSQRIHSILQSGISYTS